MLRCTALVLGLLLLAGTAFASEPTPVWSALSNTTCYLSGDLAGIRDVHAAPSRVWLMPYEEPAMPSITPLDPMLPRPPEICWAVGDCLTGCFITGGGPACVQECCELYGAGCYLCD